MATKTKSAMILAFLAGILLLVSGISGFTTWETIKNFVTENIIDNTIVQFIFAILIFIASLGGLSVITGGVLIGKNKIKTGKFLILLGAGMGLVGLIFTVAVAYVEGSLALGSFFSIGTIGLVLSIIARLIVK